MDPKPLSTVIHAMTFIDKGSTATRVAGSFVGALWSNKHVAATGYVVLSRKDPAKKAVFTAVAEKAEKRPDGIDKYMTPDYIIVVTSLFWTMSYIPQGEQFKLLQEIGAAKGLRRLEAVISQGFSGVGDNTVFYGLVGVPHNGIDGVEFPVVSGLQNNVRQDQFFTLQLNPHQHAGTGEWLYTPAPLDS